MGDTGVYLVNFSSGLKKRITFQEFPAVGRVILGAELSSIKLSNVETECLDDLVDKGFGTFEENWASLEGYHVGGRWYHHVLDRIPVNRIFIELPCKCNRNCQRCSETTYNGCLACSYHDYPIDEEEMFMETYKSYITDISYIKPQSIVFYGGNPFFEWEKIIELLRFARHMLGLSVNIMILTNGDYINDENMKFCEDNKINVVITLSDQEIKSQHKHKMSYVGMQFSHVFYNITYYDEKSANKGVSDIFAHMDRVVGESLLVSHPENRSSENLRIAHNIVIHELSMRMGEFLSRCAGTINITKNDKLLFCPACNYELNSSYISENGGLIKTINDSKQQLMDIWTYSISRVNPCSKCEFNIDCIDCRALEYNISGDILGKAYCERIFRAEKKESL